MLNLLIQFDDSIDILLYGQPDPWQELFIPRHWDGGATHWHGTSGFSAEHPEGRYGYWHAGHPPDPGALNDEQAQQYEDYLTSPGTWFDGGDEARQERLDAFRDARGQEDVQQPDEIDVQQPEPFDVQQPDAFDVQRPDNGGEDEPYSPIEIDDFLRSELDSDSDQDMSDGSRAGERAAIAELGALTDGRGADEKEGEPANATEELIIRRGRAMGLTQAQTTRALIRFRAQQRAARSGWAGAQPDSASTVSYGEYLSTTGIPRIRRESTVTHALNVLQEQASEATTGPERLQVGGHYQQVAELAQGMKTQDGGSLADSRRDHPEGIIAPVQEQIAIDQSRQEGEALRERLTANLDTEHRVRVDDEFSYTATNLEDAATNVVNAQAVLKQAESAREWLRNNHYDGSNKRNREIRRYRRRLEDVNDAQRFLDGLPREVKDFVAEQLANKPENISDIQYMERVGALAQAGNLSDYTLGNLRSSISEGHPDDRPTGVDGAWQTRVDVGSGKLIYKWNEWDDDDDDGGGGGGPIVSTDSNGYTTVRDGNTTTSYRPDGSHLRTTVSDDEGNVRRSSDDDSGGRFDSTLQPTHGALAAFDDQAREQAQAGDRQTYEGGRPVASPSDEILEHIRRAQAGESPPPIERPEKAGRGWRLVAPRPPSYSSDGRVTFTTGDATHFTTTTYWKAADGTLVVRSVDHEEHSSDQDDGQGGGGGGGGVGGGRQYTVQDDGTVKYTEDGHTYTANDDLAGDVRDAARSGDASTLSTVDRVSVSDESGDVVAANFEAPEPAGGGVAATPAGISAAEITQIEASNAELLEYADALGIGYDGQRPDFAQIRADVQQTADRQNADYVNHYLGEGTVPEGTHPTQEQIQQAGAVAADVDSLGRTSAPSQARVAADIGAQNREYVNHYLGEGTVPEGTHPTQEQIQQAGAVAADVDSLGRTSAPSQARVAADIGAQNRDFVNHYLGEGTVPDGTYPTQEQIQQASVFAAFAADDAADINERVAADLGLPADTNPAEVERAARSRAAEIEQGFRDSVLDTAPAPGSFVSSVLDSQIDAGGLPTNHPDFPEYDRIRTALDGPHWRSEQIADSTQQLLKNTTVATVDVGGAVDAFRAIGTGRHISQFDSSVPIDANLGLVPFAGTLADLNVRGRDGYSRADLAWLAGQGVLDVVPLPSGGTLVRTSKGVFLVARHPGAAAQIAIGGRRTVQSVTQGTGRAPYQLTGSRTKPAGVANIPVAFGREAIIDDLPVSAAEALLHQRDLAFAQYRATGVPQAIEVPTVGGGTQTVYVGGSRAGMETGRGAATHTSATAGEIALASAEPGGVISRPKFDATGNLLPDVENRFFVTATGAPSLVGGAALPSQRSAVSGPGFIDLVDPDNVANVGPVRKVFGGDIDTGMMRPGAVVELEAGIPAHQRIAGGDGSQLYRERPVGLQSVGGQTVHRYVDLSPAQQSGRLRVIQSNVLAGIDNLRGRTDSFYVVHRNADGTTDVVRQADLDALARSGVAPEDALRIETRSGDLRLISRQEWESSARAVSRLADGDTDESLEDRDANDRRDRDDRDGDRGGDFPLGRTNAADRNVPVASNQRAPEPRPTREGLTSQLRLPEDLTRVGIPTEPPPDVPTRGTPGAPTNPPPDVPTRGTPGAPTEPPPDVPTRGTPGAPTNPPPDVPTRGTPGTPANPPPDVPTRVPQTLRRLPGLQPPSRIPGLTKPERDRPDGDGPDAGRVELPNPVEDDPNLHPQEVRYYEVVEHTVALPSGEHTIEPVDDTALRTAEITAVGPKNPMGNVHRAGSVVLEVEDDRIVLESATRRRDANLRTAEDGAVDYSKLEYPRTEATLTSEQLAALDMPASSVDYSKLELPTSGNSLTDEQIAAIEPPKYGEQTDYTAINPGQEFRATGLGDYSHLQMPTGTEFGGGELQGGQSDRSARRPLKRPETRAELEKFQAGYRQVVGREPTGDLNRDLATYQEVVDARSKSGKSSSGVGGMDYSKLEYPAGQGPAATRNRPRSANSIDPGLVGGGRGMGRRGGGKRKREQEDDEKSKYRRPVVQVVLEN